MLLLLLLVLENVELSFGQMRGERVDAIVVLTVNMTAKNLWEKGDWVFAAISTGGLESSSVSSPPCHGSVHASFPKRPVLTIEAYYFHTQLILMALYFHHIR